MANLSGLEGLFECVNFFSFFVATIKHGIFNRVLPIAGTSFLLIFRITRVFNGENFLGS